MGKTNSYAQGGDNDDIRAALEKAIPKAKEQTKKLAQSFQGKTNKETARNIYDFLMSLQYEADGENQNIQLPSSLLKTKKADCKSYSLFTAAILENLGIPYELAYASYSSNPVPAHVYVIADGFIIDAVYGKSAEVKGADVFGKQKRPNYLYLKKFNPKKINMNINTMSGMGGTIVGDFFRDVKGAVKDNSAKVVLSVPRQVMLGVFSLNIDGISSRLQNDKARMEAVWDKMGGDPASLSRAIRDGASKPAKKLGFFDKLRTKIAELVAKKGVKITGYANGGMCGTPNGDAAIKLLTDGGTISQQYQAALGVLGTSLGGAIGSIVPALGTAVGAGAGAGIATILYQMTPAVVDAIFGGAGTNPNTGNTPAPPAPPTSPTTPPADGKKPFPTALILGIAAGGAALYFLTKKKK
jgi:hypothetical protein